MKKLLSICFLSILFTLFGLTVQAQQCCFQVNDQQITTVNGAVANQTTEMTAVSLNHTLYPQYGQTDTINVSFQDICFEGIDKVSIDWELTDGHGNVLTNFNRYVDIKFETYYNDLHWLGGSVNNAVGSFPGAVTNYQGTYPITSQGLDYFNSHFFKNAQTRMILTWRTGTLTNVQLNLKLVKRMNGTDWTNLYYWDADQNNQNLYIGGHQSQNVGIIASDTVKWIEYIKYDTICRVQAPYQFGGLDLTFGDDNTPTSTQTIPVIFKNIDACGNIIIDSLVHVNLTITENPNSFTIASFGNTKCIPPYDGKLVVTTDNNYTYKIDDESLYTTNNEFDLLNTGEHVIFIQNEYGCILDTIVSVAPAYLHPDIIYTIDSNSTCENDPFIANIINSIKEIYPNEDGQISIQGPANVQYGIAGIDTVVSVENTPVVFANLPVGTYEVEIISPQGCPFVDIVEVPRKVSHLEVGVNAENCAENTLCGENGNGVIDIQPTIESENYIYAVVHLGAPLFVIDEVSTNNVINGLVANEYIYVVLDTMTACMALNTYEITNNRPVPVMNVTVDSNYLCLDDAGNGVITITPIEGYTYAVVNQDEVQPNVEDFTTDLVYSNLSVGAYNVYFYNTLTYCVNNTTVNVQDALVKPIITNDATVTPITNCDAMNQPDNEGVITFIAKENYKYAVWKMDGEPDYSSDHVFENLSAGIYNAQVINELTGCTSAKETLMVINNVIYPELAIVSNPNYVCRDNQLEINPNGQIAITTPATTGYQFKIYGDEGHLNIDYTNMVDSIYSNLWNAGYRVWCKNDATGCVSTDSIDVLKADHPISFEIEKTYNTLCNLPQGDAVLTVNVSDMEEGVNYFYHLEGNGSDLTQIENVFNNLQAGYYNLQVANSIDGCFYPAEAMVVEIQNDPSNPGIPSVTISTNVDNNTICGDASITLTANTTPDQCSYNWGTATTQEITVTPAVTTIYNVTVTNLITNCTNNATVTVTVNENPVPVIGVNQIPVDLFDSICYNNSVTYSSIDAYDTYSWTGATTSTNREIIAETTGIYYLEVEDENGCRGMDSVNLYIRPIIDATIAVSNSVVCSETFVTATVTGGTMYEFDYVLGNMLFEDYNKENNTISGTIINSGNTIDTLAIKVKVTDQYGCSIELHDTIEVKPLPVTPAIVGFETNNVEITICYDANFVYEVTPLENVQWYNSSYTAISAQPSTSGVYHAVTIVNGCISPDTLTLTLAKTSQPIIAATISSTLDQCFTTPFNALVSSVDVTLPGYDVAHSWNYGSSTATQTYSAMAAGAYVFVDTIKVTSQDGLACQAEIIVSDTVHVWSLPLQPVITAANFVNDSILICSEEIAAYTVSGTNLTYYKFEPKEELFMQPTEVGHYTVEAKNEQGCVNNMDYYIYTIETPILTVSEITPNDTINTMYCADADVASIVIKYATADNNLMGVTYNYKWNNVASLVDTFNLETRNNTVTTFEATATRSLNGKNCVSTAVQDTLVVLFIEKPVAPITTTSVYYCTDSTLVIPAITAAAGTNYVWVGGIAPTTEGTYQLVDTLIAAPYCVSDTVTMVITMRERPVVEINDGEQELGICDGNTGTLTVTSGFATYSWSNGSTDASITIPSQIGQFVVTVTDQFACGNTDTINVITYALPTVEITPDDTAICSGNSATLIAQASTTGTYLWNDDTQSATLVVNATGRYSVVFTDEHACTATNSDTVTVYDLPIVTVGFTDSLICKMDSITLVANATSQSSNSFTYYWTYGTQTDTMFTSIYKVFPDSVASNVYPAQGITSYTVAVEDEHGCVSIPAQAQTTTITKHNYPVFIINPESRHLTVNVNEPANFSMIVDERCWNQNEKVFMHYQFLLNGEILPTDSITRYLQNIISQTGTTSTEWNNRYLFDVTDCSALYNPANPATANLTSYHKSSNGHIPSGRFLNDGYDYDWLYLYFLSDRNITANMSAFLKPGVYTIVYDIVKAGIGAQIWNQTMDGTRIIGGTNSEATLGGSYVVIASDTMTIEVVGAAIPAPEVPSSMAPSLNKATASIYPNPAVDNINVIINGVRGNTTIRIADMNGKVINAETVNISNDYYKYERSLNGLSQGIYFINIINNDAVITKKLIINE